MLMGFSMYWFQWMLKLYAMEEVQLQLNKGAGSEGGRLSFTGAHTASISVDYSGRQFNWTYYYMQ